MRLSELQTGQKAYITTIYGSGAFRKRLMEMGFVRGEEVRSILNAPLKDPIKYEIMEYEVSLRRSEAVMIEISMLQSEAWKNMPEIEELIQPDLSSNGRETESVAHHYENETPSSPEKKIK